MAVGKVTNIYGTDKSQIKEVLLPFGGEDNVLFYSNWSTVSAWPSRNGFKQIKFKFRSGPPVHNHIAPPSDRPSDNYSTNDGYILSRS